MVADKTTCVQTTPMYPELEIKAAEAASEAILTNIQLHAAREEISALRQEVAELREAAACTQLPLDAASVIADYLRRNSALMPQPHLCRMLALPKTAAVDEIKRRYRFLIRLFHPDQTLLSALHREWQARECHTPACRI